MTPLILQFAALALAVAAAGLFLTRAADELSERTGLGRTLAGLLLVAGATSLPELIVDCNAALIGAANIAIGDLLGSSLFNLLILGCVDFLHRSQTRMLSRTSAAHALSATTSIVLTGLACLFILWRVPTTLLGIGVGPLVIGAAYFAALRMLFHDQRSNARQEKQTSRADPAQPTIRGPAIRYGLATTAIFFAGRALVEAADKLAAESGLGGTAVGTTFVAFTTSLPEIVTTASAVRMGAFDMAIGNIFGSNCFNMAIIWIVDAFYVPGPILSSVDATHAVTGLFVIIITGVATMGLLYRVEKRYWLVEPDALLVVLLGISALILVFRIHV